MARSSESSADIICKFIPSAEKNHHVTNKCICRSDMELIQNLNLSTVICDICKSVDVDEDENGAVWRCSQRFNIVHPDGYDICECCWMRGTNVIQPSDGPTNHSFPNKSLFGCQQNSKCSVLKNFVAIMKRYTENYMIITEDMDKTQLIEMYDQYLHLMQKHDDDKQFQFIYDNLGYCNIANCVVFRRNNRNRMRSKDNNQELLDQYNVAMGILDTMHCYFQHCYDIGNRVSIHDKQATLNDSKLFQPLHDEFDETAYSKYNQLFINDDSKQNDVIDPEKLYSFGFAFNYNYEEVNLQIDIPVSSKYKSLKEEFLQNPFATMNVKQYDHEYEKALILLETAYCRTNKEFESEWSDIIFGIENILSLIVYCNYTKLQYELSKTYRQSNGDNHKYFYHWGRSLKICITHFGTDIFRCPVPKFYHGINKQLVLPLFSRRSQSQFAQYDMTKGFGLLCPVSTSSELAIARNFATNDGLVVELRFNGIPVDNEKYLSLSWLSAYGNEKEYLFLQGMPTMIITNIIEIKSGVEYEMIIRAITMIDKLFNGEYDPIALKDGYLKGLVKVILEDRLAAAVPDKYSKYKPFKSLSNYGRQILNRFFNNRGMNTLHYWHIRKYYSFISEMFVLSEFEGIKLDVVRNLFPDVDHIEISHIKLSSALFEYIFACLSNTKSLEIWINEVNIKNSEMSIEQAIYKYAAKFRLLGFTQCSLTDFIIKMTQNALDGDAPYMISKDVQICTNKWIMDRLLKSIDDRNEHQILFNKWCDEQTNWYIHGLIEHSFLWEFICHKNVDGWIDIDKLCRLFPNIEELVTEELVLSLPLMDDIVTRLSTTRLESISLENPNQTEFSAESVVELYHDKCAAVEWRLDGADDIGVCFEKYSEV